MAFICAKLLFLVSTKVRNNVRLLDRRYSTFYRSQSDFIGFDRRTDTPRSYSKVYNKQIFYVPSMKDISDNAATYPNTGGGGGGGRVKGYGV